MSEDEVIRSMTWQAVQNAGGFEEARDIELINLMMQCFISNGVGFDFLTSFRSLHGSFCTGLWYSRRQSVGASMLWIDSKKVSAVIAQIPEGQYKGEWIFMLDADQSILASHDEGPITSFNGLEGLNLLRTVVQTALTAPEPKAWRWRPW